MNTEKSIYGVIQMNEKQDNAIPLRRDIIHICNEKVNAAIMLTQIIYWTDRVPETNAGWLWKSDREWFEETGLTEKQCDTAREILVELDFIEIRNGVANAHRTRFYRPKTENIISALTKWFQTGIPQNEEVKPQNEEVKPQNEEVKPQNEEVKPQKGETITEITHSLPEISHSFLLRENIFESLGNSSKKEIDNLPVEEFANAHLSTGENLANARFSETNYFSSRENIDTNIFLDSKINDSLDSVSNSKDNDSAAGCTSVEETPAILLQPDSEEDLNFLHKFNLEKFPTPDSKYLYKKVKPFVSSFWIKPTGHSLENFLDLLYKAVYPGVYATDGTLGLEMEKF